MCVHRGMRTPSYVYLRTLSVADLVYCINFVAAQTADFFQTSSLNYTNVVGYQ